MDQVVPRVFIGDSSDAAMAARGYGTQPVTHILNCAVDLPAAEGAVPVTHRGFSDGGGATVEELRAAVEELERLYERGDSILVHCHVGRSRSVTVVATFLARKDKIPLELAFMTVAHARAIAYPVKELVWLARALVA